MSRPASAARFTEVVDEPAMRDLTRWRLQLARTAVRERENPIGIVAARSGYRSEATFCHAFSRELGDSTSSDRRVAPTQLVGTRGRAVSAPGSRP